MILRNHAATLGRRVKGNARFVDKSLQRWGRLRPDWPAPRKYDRPLRPLQECDRAFYHYRVGLRSDELSIAVIFRPGDRALFHLEFMQHIAGKIQVNGTRLT